MCVANVLALGQAKTGTEPEAALKRTTQLLKALSRRPVATVPDAVLNRTQCVVVILGGTGRLQQGTSACRETSDQWNNPTLVTFERKAGATRGADLLIFVLSDTGVKALRSGSLDIKTYRHALPPLAPKDAIPPERELDVELLTYQYAGGRLSGCRVHGIVRQEKSNDSNTSDDSLSHSQKKSTERYLSSLTSFFNTIIPTGIVIHHTAVLPDEDAPPKNERAVDKYHATRGFEINCAGHVYHVAYHYLILPNGHVQAGRPERCEGAHAKGYNSYLGISVVGDFDSRDNPKGEKGPAIPNEKQMAALVRLCRRLMLRYHIPTTRIVRHSDVSATRCPGDRFPFRKFLRQLKSTDRVEKRSGAKRPARITGSGREVAFGVASELPLPIEGNCVWKEQQLPRFTKTLRVGGSSCLSVTCA